MASFNRVQILGYVGRDAEVRSTQSGKSVANFSVACTERRGEAEHTEWFTITAWEKLADICGEYVKKGRQVFVEGSMKTDTWEDRKTGEKKSKQNVIARTVIFCGSKGDSAGHRSDPMGQEHNDQDIPF